MTHSAWFLGNPGVKDSVPAYEQLSDPDNVPRKGHENMPTKKWRLHENYKRAGEHNPTKGKK